MIDKNTENYTAGYALLIGIQYVHWRKLATPLTGTLNDVRDLKAHFLHPDKAAYLPENVQTLCEEEATATNILAALNALAVKVRNKPDASVLIYYSGHGESDGRHHFLVPYDFDLSKWRESRTFDADKVVLSNDFAARLSAIPAKKCLIILDCCHAENMPIEKGLLDTPFLSGFIEDISEEETVTTRGIGNEIAKGKGRIILTSCRADEKSLDLGSNGLFTQVLLECLNGTDNLKKDGWVRLIDMMDFIPRTVTARAATYCNSHTGKPYQQHPIFPRISDLEGEEFILCAYNIAQAKGLRELDESGLQDLTRLLHALLAEQQQNGIADILESIKTSGYDYDKPQFIAIQNQLNPISLSLMAHSLVQSTRALINSLKQK